MGGVRLLQHHAQGRLKAVVPAARRDIERQHQDQMQAGGKDERERKIFPSAQSSSLYQYVRVRLSSVRPGGVRHDTPEHTPCCLVPLISTTSGTGEGRYPPPE